MWVELFGAWSVSYLLQLESDALHDSYANPSGVSNFADMCVADSWAAVAGMSGWILFDLNEVGYQLCKQR